MKTASDPRHQERIAVMQDLFSQSFHPQKIHSAKSTAVTENINFIDPLISKSAPEFPLAKIAKIDLAILRLAVYELAIEKKEPTKVIIDEAVELAKEFGKETSPAFINGVLGTIIKVINK